MGSRRGTSSQKSVVPGIVRTKADTPMKTPRQRRRTGGASVKSKVTAGISCAKGEKSSTETVTVGQSSTDSELSNQTKNIIERSSNQYRLEELPQELVPSKGSCPLDHVIGRGPLQKPALECGQRLQSFMKLKLQLFPIDEATLKGLEKDEYNPYLELTLSARKKISSVLKHLNTKWGNSSIALGELVLLPYNIQQENLASLRRWTLRDTDISAADVYAFIGQPSIFRLRYGWFSGIEPKVHSLPHVTSLSFENCLPTKDSQKGCAEMNVMEIETQPSQEKMLVSVSESMYKTVARDVPLNQAVVDVDKLQMEGGASFSSALWADSLNNLSLGGLFKETSQNADAIRSDPSPVKKDSCPSQLPFCSDSFDAAIAAHLLRHQGVLQSAPALQTSILDAEETCHAFPFQKIATSREEVPAPSESSTHGAFSHNATSNSMKFSASAEVDTRVDLIGNHACQEPKSDSLHLGQGLDNEESSFRLTDINWENSLGALDLGLSSSKQIIGGDSISLSGLTAGSLDAFQNCSFFGGDEKLPST